MNYFIAGIFFYLILKRRFGESVLPLLGALAFILYPCFFGEAFYNIKDILFFSWLVISGYLVLRWLESKKFKLYFLAALALAVAINTRILGLSLLLLACVFAVIIAVRQNEVFWRAAGRPLLLFALTMVCWVLITPFLWISPIKNIIETFNFFLRVVEWDSVHLYMGRMITRLVPWHYIPVWMGITIPLPYIAMFFVGVAAICAKAMRSWKLWPREAEKVKRRATEHVAPHIYDLFMLALFFCTLLGYIFLQISMYEGWRHAYGIYFPFLYIAVHGLGEAISFVQKKHVVLRRIGGFAVAGTFAFLLAWICFNHPYQYVYFNLLGRAVAEPNFTLDYWELSHVDLIRHVLAQDSGAEVCFDDEARRQYYMLTEEEKSRMRFADKFNCNYILQNTRVPLDERIAPEGFEELYSIEVDGMKISSVYKRTARIQAEPDSGAANNILRISSSFHDGDFTALFDNDMNTRWTTGRGQQSGDFILVEFASPVEYDFFSFEVADETANEVPAAMNVYISEDGMGGPEVSYEKGQDGYYFQHKPSPYRFIVFEIGVGGEDNWWSIHEMRFGSRIFHPI